MAIDWARVKAEYIAGGTTIRELSEKYKTGFTTIANRCSSENWVKLKKEAEIKTVKKAEEKTIESNSAFASRLNNAATRLLAHVEAYLSMEDGKITTADCREIGRILKDLKDIRDIRAPGDLREQNARIKKLQREAEDREKVRDDVQVVFAGDLEDYAK